MFRRINYLKNIGKFEHLRSGRGEESHFTKYNVVYALNATGKSTLCDLFRSVGTNEPAYVQGRKRFGATTDIEAELLFRGDPPTPKVNWVNAQWEFDPSSHQVPPILVFDDRFVADNVFIGGFVDVAHRRNLYGLALGENGKRLKERVAQADNALSVASTAVAEARAELTRLVPANITIDEFRTLPLVDNVEAEITTAETELDTQKRRQAAARQITNRPEFRAFTVPLVPSAFQEVLQASLDAATIAAENTVRNHLQHRPQPLPLEWAAQGHRSQVDEFCPYCAQDMNGSPLLSAYGAFFSGALRAQEEARKRLQQDVETRFGTSTRDQLLAILVGHQTELEWWRDAVAVQMALASTMTPSEIIELMTAVHDALTAAIERKKENPSDSISLTADETSAINQWEDAVQVLNDLLIVIASANAIVREQKAAVGSVDTTALTQRVITLKNQKARGEENIAHAFGVFDQATNTKAQADREKTEANTALRDQSQAIFNRYGSQINEILERFGVEFRLVCHAITFRGGPPACELTIELLGSRVGMTFDEMRNPATASLANTLSGGDKSAVGLAYFLAVVLNDPRIGESIVVFDDPFHSQDRSRRQRTIEWVHRVASEAAQCFVFSHELDFAHNAARCPEQPGRTFVFDNTGEHPILAGSDLPDGPGSTYNQDFERLRDFAQNARGDQQELRAVARGIRPTLEYYLRVKFPGEFEDGIWLGGMISKIRDATTPPLQVAARLVNDLTEVNEFDQRFHHAEDASAASVLDAVELQSYVRQALGVISS